MTTPDDNVYPFPSLAARAVKAMADYKIGIVNETAGKGRAIRAVIEYGRALLEGRTTHGSNITFSQWVTDNKLDLGKPWEDRKERHAAMQIAEFVVGSVPTTPSKTPDNAFDACPHTRPVDIKKWYRKMHGPIASPRRSLASQIDIAYQAILEWAQLGKQLPSNMRDFGPLIGVSEKASKEAARRWRQGQDKPAESIVEAKQADELTNHEDQTVATAEAHFSDKSKLTLADAIRIHKARLDKVFETKVGEEVRRHLALIDEAMRKENAKLRKQNLAATMLLHERALFSPTDFKMILMCLHPDNSASLDVRGRAFDLVRQKEKRLVGKID